MVQWLRTDYATQAQDIRAKTNHEAYAWEGAFEDYLVDSEVTLETWLEVERINFEHCAENLLEE